MYTTRPLSMYRNDPNLLTISPTDGPNSGYLVYTDEQTEIEDVCCWGMCKDHRVKHFPFPQNKLINVVYVSGTAENPTVERDKLLFLPVLDQPLSLNRYYVIRASGKHKGLACRCSTEEDMSTCCFCNCVKDVKPSSLNVTDIYQQVEIFHGRSGTFYAKSVAPDGFPPYFLRRKGWTVETSSSLHCVLKEAWGLDFAGRTQTPDFDFPISNKCSATSVVGRWYCPFAFIKEQERLKDQMKNNMFYEMNLEQWWEEIYTCENENNSKNTVVVNVGINKELASIFGVEAVKDTRPGPGGFLWYRNVDHKDETGLSLGLNLAITEKMRWVEEVGGLVGWGETHGRVERVEEFKGGNEWTRFRCFVLVERFSLRTMDGILVLTNDFRHIHQIRCKWE